MAATTTTHDLLYQAETGAGGSLEDYEVNLPAQPYGLDASHDFTSSVEVMDVRTEGAGGVTFVTNETDYESQPVRLEFDYVPAATYALLKALLDAAYAYPVQLSVDTATDGTVAYSPLRSSSYTGGWQVVGGLESWKQRADGRWMGSLTLVRASPSAY